MQSVHIVHDPISSASMLTSSLALEYIIWEMKKFLLVMGLAGNVLSF